ncbi:ribosomal RNA small subunit methyltransferase A [Methylomagnum ishizawai]|uniref:ribosomal RNA small subunit methyltransferase A n=1 Tax=Methylomagnum ishizawai TaxID=1760988 RepID=UPI001592D151|nr:rRNA adenine N-6-methyltransferase family protein [Methylomagnum ishizawai]
MVLNVEVGEVGGGVLGSRPAAIAEVVGRLLCGGNCVYAGLNIMAGYHCRAEKLFEVYPESFHPRPKVVSAIVRLVPHATPPVEVDPVVLGKVVAAAFSQRRKTLRNLVKTLFEEREIEAMGIDPNVRAETLGLEEYARMARRWAEKSR